MAPELNDGAQLDTAAQAPRAFEDGGYLFIDSLGQPDCLLPSQFFGGRPNHAVEGEIRLLSAVLQDAINTYTLSVNSEKPQHREQFREVDFWFNAKRQRGLFAFQSVCEILGVDAQRLRRWLVSLRHRGGPARGGLAGAGRRRWRLTLGRQRRSHGPRPRRRIREQSTQTDVSRQRANGDMMSKAGESGKSCDRYSSRGTVCASS
jgi:hypothetical protein